ncbi:Ig-like domain-containing protein [Photorhabdus namnaonensis]|uniref:Bacterial Ig-like domain (Group 1) n=1 Tax=Photorhabdus namnaonensis TaxID=1851568 RepID=A0A1B8YGX0_9GAMM|nr:Ig-like domain-containing protein [Photorhabdus namnaonensis]OCA54285.1 Bacterial Ig-like domain (group 1) [Photorhabdus namnaonensis]
MKIKSIKDISDCDYSLTWINPKHEKIVGEILEETLFLGTTSCKTMDMEVKYVLNSSDVAFKIEEEESGLQKWSTKTDVSGLSYVRIYSIANAPCHFQLSASLTDYPEIISEPLSLEFIPNVVDQITWEIKTDNAEANGIDADILTAIAKDRNGNPIEGTIIDFSANRGATVSPASCPTNDKGEAYVAVTSTIDGEINVKAIAQQNGKENEIPIHFKKYYSCIEVTNQPPFIRSFHSEKVEGYLRLNRGVTNVDVSNKKINISTGRYLLVDYSSHSSTFTDSEGFFSFELFSEYVPPNDIMHHKYDIGYSNFSLSATDSKSIQETVTLYPTPV